MADFPVSIQTISRSVPRAPSWFGEVTLIACHLTRQKILERISEQVRFSRRRFGRYEVMKWLVSSVGMVLPFPRLLDSVSLRIPWGSDVSPDRVYRRLIPMDMALVHHFWWTDTLCEEILSNLISGYLIYPCTIR